MEREITKKKKKKKKSKELSHPVLACLTTPPKGGVRKPRREFPSIRILALGAPPVFTTQPLKEIWTRLKECPGTYVPPVHPYPRVHTSTAFARLALTVLMSKRAAKKRTGSQTNWHLYSLAGQTLIMNFPGKGSRAPVSNTPSSSAASRWVPSKEDLYRLHVREIPNLKLEHLFRWGAN